MRRIIWTLLTIAVLPALAQAQEQGWAAKFFPDGLTHDFGTVAFGSQLTFKFPITNIYNVPFQVTGASPGCGCTTAKKPVGAIPPRGTSELEITMDTLRVPPGPRPVNITVTLSSVPSQPNEKIFSSTCYLKVSFVSRADLTFTPGRISFGMVPIGQTPEMSLDIEKQNAPNWQILEVAKTDLPLEASLLKMNSPTRNVYRVVVKLKPTAPAGEFKHELQLKTSDGTPLTVVVEGNVQAPLAASPNLVNFGTLKLSEAKQRHIILRGPPNTPFKIVGVDGEGDGIKVKPQSPDRSAVAHVIAIEYTPTKADQLNKTLTIKTDLNGGLTATVKVEGKSE